MRHPLHSTRERIRAARYGATASMEYLQSNHTKGTLQDYTLLKDALRHPRRKDVGQTLKLRQGSFLNNALGRIIYLQTFEKDA